MTTDDIMTLVIRYANIPTNERYELTRQAIDKLVTENDTLRQRCEQAYAVGRQSGREDCEVLLQQALHLIETMPVKHPDQIGPRDALCAAIREHLKENK